MRKTFFKRQKRHLRAENKMCPEMTNYPKIILNEGRNPCLVGHVCYICSHIAFYLYLKPCQNLSSWHHFLNSIWTCYLYLLFKGGFLTSRSYIGRSWGRTIQLLFLMPKDPKKHFAIFCDKLYLLNKLSTFQTTPERKHFFVERCSLIYIGYILFNDSVLILHSPLLYLERRPFAANIFCNG